MSCQIMIFNLCLRKRVSLAVTLIYRSQNRIIALITGFKKQNMTVQKCFCFDTRISFLCAKLAAEEFPAAVSVAYSSFFAAARSLND